jgi:hypothetical protein
MVQAQLSKVDTWRQLAQQLRVGQHTLDNGRRIGSPLIFNVRSRSDGRLAFEIPEIRLQQPPEPQQRSSDLFQRTRVFVALLHV